MEHERNSEDFIPQRNVVVFNEENPFYEPHTLGI